MEEQTYKAINFDFSTKKLKENIEALNLQINYNGVYSKIGRIFEENNIVWNQESGYTSTKGMSYYEVENIISQFKEHMPYIKGAAKSMTISSVEGAFDVTKLAKGPDGLEILEPSKIHKLNKKYGLDVIDKKSTEKQIRFDFDTNKLKDILAKEGFDEDPIIVYDWTRKYFKDMGYEKVQRSVYKTSSTKPIKDVIEDVLKFSKEYEYLMPALKSFQITCIEDTFDVTHIINGKERNINKSKIVEKQANEQQIENDNGNFIK